eukprot:12606618-Alexandrium_andersonii.AAC.1
MAGHLQARCGCGPSRPTGRRILVQGSESLEAGDASAQALHAGGEARSMARPALSAETSRLPIST